MKTTTQKVILASMFAALVCVATMIIKIPSPLKGYLNLGDCVVLSSGWLLPPLYGFLAGGIGSAIADVFSGYAIYAPATFIIKGIMAQIAYWVSNFAAKRVGHTLSLVISGMAAEIIMSLGYFVYEGLLYGFEVSLLNMPANVIQGTVGLILGIILVKTFIKSNILNMK